MAHKDDASLDETYELIPRIQARCVFDVPVMKGWVH